MGEPVSFKPDDTIKFSLDGFVAETGRFFLPQLRDRTYFGVTIIEKNGEKVPPTNLEVGLFNDELPHQIKFNKQPEGVEIIGLNPANYMTATLTGGFPRARAEDAGQWQEFRSVPFIQPATLKETDEAVPTAPATRAAAVPLPVPREEETGAKGRRWPFSRLSNEKK